MKITTKEQADETRNTIKELEAEYKNIGNVLAEYSEALLLFDAKEELRK
jgi:hydrogenase maturation factor